MIKMSGQLWVEIALIFLYNIRQRLTLCNSYVRTVFSYINNCRINLHMQGCICGLLVGLLGECRNDKEKYT